MDFVGAASVSCLGVHFKKRSGYRRLRKTNIDFQRSGSKMVP
jgi:hypothetical protein